MQEQNRKLRPYQALRIQSLKRWLRTELADLHDLPLWPTSILLQDRASCSHLRVQLSQLLEITAQGREMLAIGGAEASLSVAVAMDLTSLLQQWLAQVRASPNSPKHMDLRSQDQGLAGIDIVDRKQCRSLALTLRT